MKHTSDVPQTDSELEVHYDDLEALPSDSKGFNEFISHELRTPLTSIIGVLKLLQSGYLGSLAEEEQSFLKIALRGAHRLVRLVEAIEHNPIASMTILSNLEMKNFELETDLLLAIERQEFQLFYQPIICIESDSIIGFEALSRWLHPQRGWIAPTVFIPIIEKLGLMDRLCLWCLRQACYQLRIWQQQFINKPSLIISVNLSTSQLLQPNLVQEIIQILQDYNVSPSNLKLEIVDSALSEDCNLIHTVLVDLEKIGVRCYIDDFGVSYSSLGSLSYLPIEALKIDCSFISGKQWGISEAILLLAKRLRLDVIAEGIETSEELEILKALGCKQMQGYFFSKPVDSETATALISTPRINHRQDALHE